jgi:NADH-quinone oxidoreductase subunit A
VGQSQATRANVLDDAAMLFLHPKSQSLFARGIERKQVKKAIRTAVKNTAPKIDGCVDERLRGSALFCLDVVRCAGNGDVRVVTECHFSSALSAQAGASAAPEIPPYLTGRRLNRYYSNSPMTDSGLHTYAPLLLHLLIATLLAGALTAVSVLVGWRRPSRAKQQPYECGMEPTGDAREPFSVKFYLVAMVFILFDVEAIFLYPWAYIFRSLRWYGFVEMMIYIAVLLVGYLYLWKKGALDWHK